jgi:ribonuclease H2 subunit A
VTERADSKYKVVGAASIKAKAMRDHWIAELDFEEGDLSLTRDFGSGYPGDETTAEWLKQNFDPVFGYPSIARFSWGPVAEMFKKRQAVADFDGMGAQPPRIDSAFFAHRKIRTARI